MDRVEHELTVDGDGWRVRSVVPALNATAELTLEPEPSWPYALDVQLDNTSLASLGALAPTGAPGRVEGALTVRLQADGSVTAPADSTVVVVLEQMAGDVNGTSVLLVAPAEVRYARDRIDVDSLDLRVGETRLTASGSLEPTAGSGLRVGLRGDLRHLEWLLPRGDRLEGAGSVAMSGPFQIDASVTGPVEQPELTASLVLDDGVVSLEGAPPLSDLRVRAGYDATGVRLDELRGSWAGAALAASGAIPPPLLAPYLPGRLRFAEGTDSTARFRATVGGDAAGLRRVLRRGCARRCGGRGRCGGRRRDRPAGGSRHARVTLADGARARGRRAAGHRAASHLVDVGGINV